MGGALGGKPEPPQYAQFEVGRSGLAVDPKPGGLSEDALPPMPSWDNASKKRVLTEEEKNGVELGELDPATGQSVPLMTGAAAVGTSMPPSPAHDQSPFGPPGQAIGAAYSDVPGDQYGQNQQSLSPHNGPGYGPGPGRGSPGYGPSSQSPGGFNGQGRGQFGGPGRGAYSGQGRGGYDGQGRGGYNDQGQGYGPPSPQDPYGADNNYTGAATGGYGRPPPNRQNSGDNRRFPQPQRQYSSDSSRPLNPGRQYSDQSFDNFQPNGPPRGPSRGPGGPGGPGRMASPPRNNTEGFDFGTGAPQQYPSRPSPPLQQNSYGSSNSRGRPNPPMQGGRNGGNDGYYAGSTAPPSYASRSPPPQEPSYPGYRPYQPSSSQGGRGAPSSSAPGGGRGRDPNPWDPVRE